jgi:hypothetical protein
MEVVPASVLRGSQGIRGYNSVMATWKYFFCYLKEQCCVENNVGTYVIGDIFISSDR